MRLKKIIKKVGKRLFILKQVNERIIDQSVLIIDNGYSWLGQLGSAIESIKNYFPRSQISVLTFKHRKCDLEKDFPALNYIIPSARLRSKGYRIVLQMLKMRKMEFDFIVLVSIDISLVIIALMFIKSKVALYNQWGQWWLLQLRNIKEIFKVTYIKKKVRFNFKNLLKRIGLFFILLQRKDEEALKHRILVIDNGYARSVQIDCVVQRIKESLPRSRISVLTLEQRKELRDKFPDLKFIKPDKSMIATFRTTQHIFRLRRNRYDCIVLLSLDITLIMASILSMNSKVILYNQWHQWWSLKPKSINSYLVIIPQFIFNLIIFGYLLISVSWIFLKRSFNNFKFSLLREKP